MNAESHPTDGTRPAEVDDGGSVDQAVLVAEEKGTDAFELFTADWPLRGKLAAAALVVCRRNVDAGICLGADGDDEDFQNALTVLWEVANEASQNPHASEVSSLTAQRDRLREERDRLARAGVGLDDAVSDVLGMYAGDPTSADEQARFIETLRTAHAAFRALSTTPAPDAPAEDAETHA